jgi:hypothetical protein
MKTREDLIKILSKKKLYLKEKYTVTDIGIFGSYAREEQKDTSDIDIFIDFEETPDLLTFIEIESYLEDLLKMKVDLVRKKSIRQELKESILSEGIFV